MGVFVIAYADDILILARGIDLTLILRLAHRPWRLSFSITLTLSLLEKCREAFGEIAGNNKVSLVLVPSHMSVRGSEEADRLAGKATQSEPETEEPAIYIPQAYVKGCINSWTRKKHTKFWTKYEGRQNARSLLVDNPKRVGDLDNK
ncbi:unnamed protein product [Brassicogethes aeneus]|uniref:RNase H type-1 domain-containing protein n=1 Tax=Brassicogethes aeneus TaxID=1431903 RepID=A0A9P0B6K6_BRAAE|nr:unnamed protein product [Brassicogethes aeneus]